MAGINVDAHQRVPIRYWNCSTNYQTLVISSTGVVVSCDKAILETTTMAKLFRITFGLRRLFLSSDLNKILFAKKFNNEEVMINILKQ